MVDRIVQSTLELLVVMLEVFTVLPVH